MFILTIRFIFLLFIFSNLYAATSDWKTITPGIAYLDIAPATFASWSHIHVFRIDLTKNRLSLLTAQQIKKTYASAQTFAKASNALIAINGGFFDHNFDPLGLRIQNSHIISRLKPISWWGVFYIADNHAWIKSMQKFRQTPQIEMAIQSGPRLIIDGKIPHLKPGIDQRTALCITKTNNLILLVTERAAISTTQLAQYMKAPPLACHSAINLDGGSSSQLFMHIKNLHLNVPGLTSVSDALVVTPIHAQSIKSTTYPQDNLSLLA